MIEVDPKTNWIKHEQLNEQETKTFLKLMDFEIKRHETEYKKAKHNATAKSSGLEILFWSLQMKNHKKDIQHMNETIGYLKNKHNIQ